MVTREISGQPVPKVSLCIPVYNGARFLAETMRSALAQDYADFELVVSDNASTDETPQVVAGFDDPRIVYSRSERNLGPVGNFNRCLELARGRYTKILCADDLLYPTCLSRQVAILEEDAGQAISLVSCARDIIDADSRVRWRSRSASRCSVLSSWLVSVAMRWPWALASSRRSASVSRARVWACAVSACAACAALAASCAASCWNAA